MVRFLIYIIFVLPIVFDDIITRTIKCFFLCSVYNYFNLIGFCKQLSFTDYVAYAVPYGLVHIFYIRSSVVFLSFMIRINLKFNLTLKSFNLTY